MSKKLRVGRILLDYLRNDRMSTTAVAPFVAAHAGVRRFRCPSPGAKCDRGLDPQRFTMITAPAILVRSKPWADYEQVRGVLKAAIRKLVGANKGR